MEQLSFSPDLKVPMSVVTQKAAFLGISGSGKTYGSGKLVELVLEAGGQVVVIDTIGNWWGLRLASNGKSPGLSIPILGGAKGDVPLDSMHGKLVAETVVSSRSSMVLDVSDFTAAETRRFVTEFATNLLRLKKSSPSPVLVVWEECQDIVPQKVFGEDAKMVGAVERLIKKGRNYGVGTILISQRAAAVNKDVLNQIESLFVFRLNASHDRKAIENWIVDHSVDVGALVDELPALPTGKCFVWSPQFLKFLGKVTVGKKKTFDASATPEFGEQVKAGELAPVDLEKFKKSMGEALENAKANDPALLKAKIKELQEKIDIAGLAKVREALKPKEVSVLKPADIKRLERLVEKMLGHGQALNQMRDRLAQAQQAVVSEAGNLTTFLVGQMTVPPPKTFFLGDQHTTHHTKAEVRKEMRDLKQAKKFESSNGELSKCAREILAALRTRHPEALTRTQVATLSGYSQNSSGFANALSQLNTGGYIEKNGGNIGLTHHGLLSTPAVDAPVTPEELLNLWAPKLGGKAGTMLRVLAERGNAGLTREHLADAVGLSITSSGFANYLSMLNSNGLIRKEGGVIKASPLFQPQ